MVFERNSKSVSGKLTLCFKEVLKEFQGSLKTTSSREISEKVKGFFQGRLVGIQGNVK